MQIETETKEFQNPVRPVKESIKTDSNLSKLGALLSPKESFQAKPADNNEMFQSPRSSIFTLQEIGSGSHDDEDFVWESLTNKNRVWTVETYKALNKT